MPESINKARQRIENISMPEPNSGCWFWMGYIMHGGYGRASYRGKKTIAHRLSYLVYKGEIPDGLFVCHRCDIRSCVNPDHLFLGTHEDNMRDREKKGRAVVHRGEANASSKLTSDNVTEILLTDTSHSVLGRKFNVTPQCIFRIRKGFAWKNHPARKRIPGQLEAKV